MVTAARGTFIYSKKCEKMADAVNELLGSKVTSPILVNSTVQECHVTDKRAPTAT